MAAECMTGDDEKAILERLDRSSSQALLNSLVREMAFLTREISMMRARLEVFESVKHVADRVAASENDNISIIYPTRFSIGAGHSSLSAPEFHALEYAGDGTPLRWTGPERHFSFRFFVDRRVATKFSLEFDSVIFTESIETLQCFVDGAECLLALGTTVRGRHAIGHMPIRRDRGGSVLTFVCPRTRTPESQDAPDQRKLGLLFRKLTVEVDETSLSPADRDQSTFSDAASVRFGRAESLAYVENVHGIEEFANLAAVGGRERA